MYEHNVFRIILVVLALAVYIVTVALNAVAGSGLQKGLFLQAVGNLSNKYNTDFTPAGWTFMIWNVIYAWQFVWFGYVLSLFCRRTDMGWFYLKPDLFPVQFYAVWILNNAFNIGWLFLWDREHTIPALAFLAAIAFTNYIVLFFSYRAVFVNGDWLQKVRKVDLWLIRILVHNGIAVYTTWTTIATLLNFAVVLTYNGGYPNRTSSIVALAILAFEVILWFCLENFLLDKYVRYTLTVYPVIIVALSGALNKNYDATSPASTDIFIAVLLAVACALFVARLIIVFVNHFRKRLYGSALVRKSAFPMS